VLDGTVLRSFDPDEAVRVVPEVRGLEAFAAELVVARGANAPDALPGTSAGSTPTVRPTAAAGEAQADAEALIAAGESDRSITASMKPYSLAS